MRNTILPPVVSTLGASTSLEEEEENPFFLKSESTCAWAASESPRLDRSYISESSRFRPSASYRESSRVRSESENPRLDKSIILVRAGCHPSFLYKESSRVRTESARPSADRSYISESLGRLGLKPSFHSQYSVRSRNRR